MRIFAINLTYNQFLIFMLQLEKAEKLKATFDYLFLHFGKYFCFLYSITKHNQKGDEIL